MPLSYQDDRRDSTLRRSANLLIQRGGNVENDEAKMTTPVGQPRPSNTYRSSVERCGDTWLAVGNDHDIHVPCSSHIPPCQVYFPGHVVHWVQVNLSIGEPHLTGTLAGVGGGVIAIDFGEQITFFQNHEPEHLIKTIGIGGTVQICDKYSLLISGDDYFSILNTNEPLGPCKYDALTSTSFDALAERLRTHGGYTVPGSQVLDSPE